MRFLGFIFYSIVYLVGLGSVIAAIFDVSPFACYSFAKHEFFVNPLEDWSTLYHAFMWNQWAVDSSRNLAIFLIFIFFFPCWILFWFLIRKIRFFKALAKPFYFLKSKNLEKQAKQNPQTTQKHSMMTRPLAMPKSLSYGSVLPSEAQKQTTQSNNQGESNTAATASTATSAPSTTQLATESVAQDDFSNEAPSPAPISETPATPPQSQLSDDIKQTIENMAKTRDYQLYDNILLGETLVPYVFLKDPVALLFIFLTKQTEWFADETVSEGEDKPTWFATDGLITSPVYTLKQASDNLQQLEPESKLTNIVVLTDGTIINSDVMQEAWSQSNTFVVRLNESVQCENLMTLEQLLDTHDFGFQGSETEDTEPDESDDATPDDEMPEELPEEGNLPEQNTSESTSDTFDDNVFQDEKPENQDV